MSTLSVCIATHERPQRLRKTLDALAAQVRRPNEIVVSDSSASRESEEVVSSFGQSHPLWTVKYVKSDRKALPWQRWWAFSHSLGEVVFFLDDDIHLEPLALEVLEDTWSNLANECHSIAGVGFIIAWADGERVPRHRNSLAERWLGTSSERSGVVTAGGLAVSIDDLVSNFPLRVDRILGGAMSFRRHVLEAIGPLDHLATLYDRGLGRGEDVVLSCYARRHGSLYIITQPPALHPRYDNWHSSAPYSSDGWLLGLTATWGRAHTLRWTSTDRSAYKQAWTRIATLELARSIGGMLRRPHLRSRWKRLGGACYGIMKTICYWNRVPLSASSALPSSSTESGWAGPAIHDWERS